VAFYGEIFSSSDPQETAITRINSFFLNIFMLALEVDLAYAQLLCYSK
jgi:hypothetical protein